MYHQPEQQAYSDLQETSNVQQFRCSLLSLLFGLEIFSNINKDIIYHALFYYLNYYNMHQYVPSQQNININIFYNIDGSQGNKFMLAKNTTKNTKIFSERECLDLKQKAPKKAEEICNKLQENRLSLKCKSNKPKKKIIKEMNYLDSLINKRFKTQISSQINPSATTNKKSSKKSKIFTKSSSQPYPTLNQEAIQHYFSSPNCKNLLQPKQKKKLTKSRNKSCSIISRNKKISQISHIKHINSAAKPQSKIPKKNINSANTIPSQKMIKSIVEKSMLTSQIGDSIPMRSENNTYETISSSIRDLNLMINSIDIRLIKKMEVDNEANKKPITKDLQGEGINLITYLNKIKRIPMQQLHTSATIIQRFWRQKIRQNIVQYYSGLFNHATSEIKPPEQFSQISNISGNQEGQQISSHQQVVEKIQIQEGKLSKEKKIEQLNNINKISLNNSEKLEIQSKQQSQFLLKQSIGDDISGNSQKVSHESVQQHIYPQLSIQLNQKTQKENSQSYEQHQKRRNHLENNQNIEWVEEQIRMENGAIQNYLDCGLSNFELNMHAAIHHNSKQQPAVQLFSGNREEKSVVKGEEIFLALEESDIEEHLMIKDQINVKRKEKVVENIFMKLVEDFAMDVSNILKKTQNLIQRDNLPVQSIHRRIITNPNNITQFITELKTFILEKQEYCDEIIKNLRISIGPTSSEILSYLRFDEQEGNEENGIKQQKEDKEQEGVYIIPNNLFDVLNQKLFEKEQQKNEKTGKALSKKVKYYFQFWNQSLFECFNECLDYERAFGLNGAPYAWITDTKFSTKKQLAHLPSILNTAETRLLQLTFSPSGIIFDKPDSLYRQQSLTEECKYQLNEQRMSKMLASSILQDQINWITYNDEMTELMIEITQMIERIVMFQAATDIKKIKRRRKIIASISQEESQKAVFHLQEL